MFIEHLKNNLSKTVSKIIIVVILIFILLFCYLLYFFISSKSEKAKPIITSSFIQSKLENIDTLSSVKYMYTNIGRFEDRNEFKGITIPFSSKSFVISYDGVMSAGIEVDKIKVKNSNNKIIIDLPASKIISHEIKEETIEVFDETKNIFNQISVKDYSNFTTEEKKKMEKKAIDNGLLIEADKEAQKSIKDLIILYDENANNDKIIFEDFDEAN